MGSHQVEEIDVLLVGAGFASYTLLNRLRKLGFGVKIYEKGSASGGIWFWNCYPGARVDSDLPIYQLFDKELWEGPDGFTFQERYPGGPELKRYFQHVDKTWKISEHVEYNKHVDGAVFDEERHQWLVECSDGSEIYCNYFIPCIGFASRRYSPPVNGLGDFQGDIYHTAIWPQHGVNLKNKRIAQIGTGASGIQVAQETADKAKHFTLFQRTPNMCLPMNQKKLDPEEEKEKKASGWYEEQMAKTRETFAGFTYDFSEKNTFDDTPEEREQFYRSLIEQGGFRFWLNTYKDMLFDKDANYEAYKFWRSTVLKRVSDPKKAALLAPEVPPHPWGTKRPSLEQRFYEAMSNEHVDIVDINTNPIVKVVKDGLELQDGTKIEIDVLILATGFDSVTGSLAQLNIQGTTGGTIADHWKDGLTTSMGIALATFPNMFFLYGPQAPTAFSNGPSCTQFQAEWVEKTMKQLKDEKITRFEATKESEDDWTKRMHEKWDASLFPQAKSWYQGANIPGRKVEPLNWSGGMVEYVATLNRSLENDYQGWKTQKAS